MHLLHNDRYNLIIECCRVDTDPQKLESLISQIDDWEGFLTSAYLHGVFPLVAKSLRTLDIVPEPVKEKLKQKNQLIARRNMMMSLELIKIIKLLEDNGIQSIALKGPVLSHQIHQDVTLRQYADIDILILNHPIYDVGKVLTENGYVFDHHLKFLKNKTLLKVAKDFLVTNTNNHIHIEVHWKLFDSKLFQKSNLRDFYESPRVIEFNKSTIMTLEQTVNMLFLLVHGSKHLWERVEWVVDIDRLVRLEEEQVDWVRLEETAKVMEIEPMIYLGLSIAHKMFGTPIPHSMLHLQNNAFIQRASDMILQTIYLDQILQGEQEFLGDWRDIGSPEIKNKKLYKWIRGIKLTQKEIFEIDLPPFLSPLYYLLIFKRLFHDKYFPIDQR